MEELSTANNAVAGFLQQQTSPYRFTLSDFVAALSDRIVVRTGMCYQCGHPASILAVRTVPSNGIIYDTGAIDPQCFVCNLNDDDWEEDYAAWKEAVDSAKQAGRDHL